MDKQLEMPKKKVHAFKFSRRHVMILAAVLLIAAAVVLNFTLFSNAEKPLDSTPTDQTTGGENTPIINENGYFSATQVSRQRARDEALEVLQSVVDNESASETAKTEALLEIATLAKVMEKEANIESLIRAKGFEQCVAIINGETCSVVVNGEKLQDNQIAQINEIIFEQAGIKPANIRIITK